MHLCRCSLIFIIVLNATLKSTIAITGCIVTLLNTNSSRRKVLCADPKGPIDSIPEDLPQSTDMLIISNQNITTVNENDFSTVSQIKTLLLTYSNLGSIHKYSFKLLVHLVVLDLSGNRLTISVQSLPVEIFSNLPDLQYLKLTGNPLGFIPDLIFKPMSKNLRKLLLNKCDSPALRISPRAFQGINNIEELDIRDSGLVNLFQPMEADLRDMKLLKVFLVGGNNFQCDCKLRWFYFFLTQIQDTVKISEDGDKDVRCSSPDKLANKPFPVKEDQNQLRYTDFICSPKCSLISAREIIAAVGSSVNLTCDCFTDPIQRMSWTKNGHTVEEMTNKYEILHVGKEKFQSTLNILSLQPVDSGNWSCKLDIETSQNFSLKVNSSESSISVASINVYILVGLGSSLFLISLVVVMVVMFCRRDTICNLRNQHPMVICGYESNLRKASLIDGDVQYRYNQQDGRFNTSFYENTIPFDPGLAHYQRSNHLYQDDLLSEKSYTTKVTDMKSNLSKPNNDKMLNVYCGCNYTSDEDPDPGIMQSSCTQRSRSSKPFHGQSKVQSFKTIDSPEEKFQQLKLKSSSEIERLIPKSSQCPFHGSSGTLTRIPGEKPCPVHGSTATLPSRLSSKKVEHRFGCPKHNTDNISVKSLKLDSFTEDHPKPHRCKSVSKIPSKLDGSSDKLEIQTPTGYRPCPLHGDVLAAINENLFEPISSKNDLHLTSIKKSHSKTFHEKSLRIPAIGCDRIGRKPINILKNRNDLVQLSSVSISHALISPVQSSLSSSPLLTSDVHGTLV